MNVFLDSKTGVGFVINFGRKMGYDVDLWKNGGRKSFLIYYHQNKNKI